MIWNTYHQLSLRFSVTEFDNNDVMAQAMLFFEAGFETSSTTITMALYELATNPDIQKNLRTEIQTVLKRHNGQITYEGVTEMEYLDRVLAGEWMIDLKTTQSKREVGKCNAYM